MRELFILVYSEISSEDPSSVTYDTSKLCNDINQVAQEGGCCVELRVAGRRRRALSKIL